MSTMRGSIQPAHPIGRQVWVTAIVALVLVAAVAVAVGATRLDVGSIGFVPAPVHHMDTTSVPVEGYRGPHGPNQPPKRMPTRDFRPHGPNQMPKR